MAKAARPTGKRGHEADGVTILPVVGVAVGLAICLIAAALVAWALLGWLRSNQPSTAPPAANSASLRFPMPALQTAPTRDLQAFRAEKQAELNSYRWLDRSAGTVRIPIDRAMQLLAARNNDASQQIDIQRESRK